MPDYSVDALFDEMERSAARTRAALEGAFAEEYKAIRSLDPETIAHITPDTTDEAVYEQLMAVVQEASARNWSQAQLTSRIRDLGDVAMKIAAEVPKLAKILL